MAGVDTFSMNAVMKKLPLVAIVGPTASGKTAFSIEIAKRFDGEIISMDSMQIYKEMQIGTAKPTEEEKEGIVHHMLDVAVPGEAFTVNDYAAMVRALIPKIVSRGKLPILCGGTGLYFNAVIYGYNLTEAATDPAVRDRLFAFAEQYGVQALFERLEQVDPKSAEEIHPNNLKRVVRALEVYELTGRPKSEQVQTADEPLYRLAAFGLDWPRQVLYERIDHRVDQMLADGLEAEVRALAERGVLHPENDTGQAAAAIGYREMLDYIAGKTTFEEMVETLKRNTRRYAKRQCTWFKRIPEICWVDPLDQTAKEETVKRIEQMLEK